MARALPRPTIIPSAQNTKPSYHPTFREPKGPDAGAEEEGKNESPLLLGWSRATTHPDDHRAEDTNFPTQVLLMTALCNSLDIVACPLPKSI